jgi:hypothetical protein
MHVGCLGLVRDRGKHLGDGSCQVINGGGGLVTEAGMECGSGRDARKPAVGRHSTVFTRGLRRPGSQGQGIAILPIEILCGRET